MLLISVDAWPSSVRALKCLVRSLNGRNPCCFLIWQEVMRNASGRKDDVRSVHRLWIGLHMWYNGCYNRMLECEFTQIPKSNLSSDCFLKLESMKSELLVIAYHYEAVNILSLSYTQPVRRRKYVEEDISDDFGFRESFLFYVYK